MVIPRFCILEHHFAPLCQRMMFSLNEESNLLIYNRLDI